MLLSQHCLNTDTRLYYHNVSLLFGSAIPTSLFKILFTLVFTSTADIAYSRRLEVWRTRARLRELRHAQRHVVQYKCNGVQRLYSVENASFHRVENRHGTNILVVKCTAHTRLKEIRAKATVIALASFDVG